MEKRVRVYTLLLAIIACFSLGVSRVNADNVAHYFDVYKCPVSSDDYVTAAEDCLQTYEDGDLESYKIANNGNLSLHGDAEGLYKNLILVIGKLNVKNNIIRSFNTTWNWDPNVLSLVPSEDYSDEHVYDASPYNLPYYIDKRGNKEARWTTTVNFMRYSADGVGIILAANASNDTVYDLKTSNTQEGVVEYFREFFLVNPDAEIGTYTNIIMNSADKQFAEATNSSLQAVDYDISNYRLKIYGTEENDATLGTFTVSATSSSETPYTMSPAFEPGQSTTIDYTVVVPNDITSVYAAGTANSIHAKSINGVNGTSFSETYSDLEVGANEKTIIVSAANGDILTYTLTIYRLSNEATLKTFTLTDADISFNETVDLTETKAYTATVPYRIGHTTINAETSYDKAFIGADEEATTLEQEWDIDPDVLGSTTTKTFKVYSESCKYDYIDLNGNTSDKCQNSTYSIALTREPASTDSSLDAISVVANEQLKTLDKKTYTTGGKTYDLYEVTDKLAHAIDTVTINASATDEYARVTSGTGDVSINVGDNYLPVVITAEDGSTTTYYVFVHRKNNDATLSNLQVTSNPHGSFAPDFSPGMTNYYTYTYDATVSNVTITATTNDQTYAKVAINDVTTGTTLTPNEATLRTQTQTFNVSSSDINIVVTAEDGTVSTYILYLARTKSSNSYLVQLKLKETALNELFSTKKQDYTSSIDGEYDSVTLQARPSVVYSNIISVKLNNQEIAFTADPTTKAIEVELPNLQFPTAARPANIIQVVVQSESLDERTYTIELTRDLYKVATLESLSVTGYTFNEPFQSDELDYTITSQTVPYATTSINIQGMITNEYSTVKLYDGNNQEVTPVFDTTDTNKFTGTLPLHTGENTVKVKVYAHNTAEQYAKTYTITISRLKNTNTSISSILVNGSSTTPTLNPGDGKWYVIVPNTKEELLPADVTVVKSDPNATVEKSEKISLSTKHDNEYTFRVTAEDGESYRDYTLVVTRAKSKEKALTGVEIYASNDGENFLYQDSCVPVNGTCKVTVSSSTTHFKFKTVISAEATITPEDTTVYEMPPSDSTMTKTLSVSAEDPSVPVSNYSIVVERGLSSNPRLSDITLNGESVENFDPEEKHYYITYPHSVDKVTVGATVEDVGKATIYRAKYNGHTVDNILADPFDLQCGQQNEIIIDVQAENTDVTRSYYLHITREFNKDADLTNILLDDVGVSSFTPGNTSYAASDVEYEKTSIKVTALLSDTEHGSFTITNVDPTTKEVLYTADNLGNLTLNTGDNEIVIAVQAHDVNVKKNYRIYIKRKLNSNINITKVKVAGIQANKESDTIYSVTVPNNVDVADQENVVFEFAPGIIETDPDPTYEVTTKNLLTTVVSNAVTVVVTAPDGITDEIITVNVTREKSNKATLNTLTLSSGGENGTFDPLFVADDESKTEINYEVTVPKDNDYFSIAYTVTDKEHITDEKAVVTCELNEEVVDCDEQMEINAISGLASLKVYVQSEDESVTRTYIITLARVKSSDTTLGSLVMRNQADGTEIVQEIIDGVINAHAPANVNDVTLEIVPNSPYAQVESILFNSEGVSFNESLDHLTYGCVLNDLSYVAYPEGLNIVIITIMAEDGTKEQHPILLYRDYNSDTTLKSYKVDNAEQITNFENTATRLYEYRYANVDYTKTYIEITNETTDSFAEYSISGGEKIETTDSVHKVYLKTGSNAIVTTVTAQDGTVGYYYFYITRRKNTDNSFNSLYVSDKKASCNLTTRICTVVVPNETLEVNNENVRVVFNPTATDYDAEPRYNVQTTELNEGIITNVMMSVTAEDGSVKDYIIKVTRAPSDISTLDNIIVTTDVNKNGSFTPAFKKDVLEYTVGIDSAADAFTVVVEKTNANAVVTGDGAYSFTVDDTDDDETIVIPIHVTSQSGETETEYTLTIVRGLNTIATLGSLKVYDDDEKNNEYTLTPEFVADNVGKVDYDLDVAGDIGFVYIDTAVTAQSRATISSIKVNGSTITDESKINSFEGYIPLVSNTANLVLITVLSEDTYSSTVYRLTINRAANSDNKLSSLKVKGIEYINEEDVGYENSMYLDENGDYRVDGIIIPNFKSSIDVSAIKSDPNATFNTKLKIANGSESTVQLGDINIPVGTNEITITVTAEDGTSVQKYIIEVTREPSTDATASYVMFYDQLFTIQEGVYDYYYVVTNPSLKEITDADVTVTTASSGATVVKPGTTQIITSANNPAHYTYYASTYTFTVVAEDKTTEQEYVFYIHKDYSNNANLKAVNLSKGTVSPKFNSSVATYTITLPYGTSTFEVEGIPEEDTTTVTGNTVYNYEDNLVIQLKTLAEDKETSQTYKFAVIMAESTDAYLNSLSVVSYSFKQTFKKTLFNYDLEDISFGTTHLAVAYTKSNSAATVVCDMDGTVDNCEAMSVPQTVGSHRITVNVTAEDSVTTKTYTIDFEIIPSANAYLLDLTAEDSEGNALPFGFSRAITSGYVITVPYTTDEVIFEATATSEYATLNIGTTNANGTSSEDINYYHSDYTFSDLVVGQNIIYVKVIPQDPNAQSKTYSVIINRAKREASKVTTLSSLEILDPNGNAYTLDPAFTLEESTYDIGTIPYLDASATVNVTTTDTNANTLYLVNGIVQPTNNVQIPITTGNGYIQIIVIAEDGETMQTYTINYKKEASDNWKLWDLYISNQFFAFNPNIQDYYFTYGFDVTSAVISFKPEVEGTSVKIGQLKYNAPINQLQTYTVPFLNVGENEIMIECTAEDGTPGYYKIVITREASDEVITSETYGHTITNPEDGTVGYVLDVATGTTSAEFKTQLDNDDSLLKIFDALDNEEVPDGDPIGTGMIAKLIINKNEADRKVLVVPGDSNGDAAVDIFDLLVMVDHILEATPLEGPYYEAGDYDRNVDLDIYDLLAVVDVIINS